MATVKETVPVILIHDWDGDRTDMLKMAAYLQQESGHAVIVPDLRGHGESITVKGVEEELDRKRFKKNELATLVEDIDVCRKFLQDKNDLGELNLDLLVLVACGKTCAHAAAWAITDWSWQPIGGVKQGQNVKSLIMISPQRKFKTMSLTSELKHPLFTSKQGALPMLLIWGRRHAETDKDGNSIYKSLEKSRSQPADFKDADDRWQNQTVFKIEYDSSSESVELLSEQENSIHRAVGIFIDNKIVANQDEFSWQSRALK